MDVITSTFLITWVKRANYIYRKKQNNDQLRKSQRNEYYQAIADKANVVLFGLQGKLD